jgi:FkbH-like protein
VGACADMATNTRREVDVRTIDDVSAAVLARAQAQATLHADEPRRTDLLALDDLPTSRAITVRVHRNVAAERLITPLLAFARFSGLEVSADFGPYDDSLAFAALDPVDPDVELVWLDIDRVPGLDADELAEFLVGRLMTLRAMTGAPVLVFDVPGADIRSATVNAALADLAKRSASLFVCPVSELAAELGESFFSTRASSLTAVPLSGPALLRLAQRLGLVWLPAALGHQIRAIAVDLDNTMYDGVLGEDGIDGVVVTDDHRRMQLALKELHERGIFLAVVSRNELADVEALFDQRDDFVLTRGDIDAWGVSWGAKSVALQDIADQLRIAPGTFAFIDDNPGELVEVAGRHPDLTTIFASDPAAVRRVLALSGGLFRFADAGADRLRAHDLRAETERRELQTQAADPNAYLAALAVELTFALDRPGDLARLAELSHKTNQFTTALARLTQVQLAERQADPSARVVSVHVKDKLADSGIVTMISARRQADGSTLVEDICVSCRALGRGLEDVMLRTALDRIATELNATELTLATTTGPRNAPARDWLTGLDGEPTPIGVRIVASAAPKDVPVTIIWEDS